MKRKYGLTDDYREIQSIYNYMCHDNYNIQNNYTVY